MSDRETPSTSWATWAWQAYCDGRLVESDHIAELEANLAKAIWELERLGFDFDCIVGRELKGGSSPGMTDHKLPQGRRAMTDADMCDLARRLADTSIEQSALYQAAIKRAEDAEAKLEKALRVFDDMRHDRIGFRNVGYFRRIATVIGKELRGEK